MEDVEDPAREIDRLLAATIYLMTCHAHTRCPRLACIVERHLALIARHAESGELVRATSRRLAAAWKVIRSRDERNATDSMEAAAAERGSRLIH